VAAAASGSWNPFTMLGRFLTGAEVAPKVAVDDPKLAAAVAGLAKQVDRQPQEGGVAVKGTTATAVQPVAGRTLDRQQAATVVRAAYLTGTAPVALPVVEKQPAVDAAEVQRADGHRAAACRPAQADHGAGPGARRHRDGLDVHPAVPLRAYRKQNIDQAAQRINGTLLLPGQTYSQNETPKERTAANGYTIGTIILNGRFFED